MFISPPMTTKDQKEKPNFLLEVANTEKQFWLLIHSKGLLHSDVQELYRKICSSYEKIILSDYELTELQNVEYSLWKLHYRHIDEFRKRMKRISAESESTMHAISQNDVNANHIEGFKTFLLEAAEFYKDLIVKIRNHNGLPKESSIPRRGGISIEPKKLQKCEFLCHRFLVCLGDLARYREQYEKSSVQNPDWSVAATYYLEATMIWPESGNPQNQLAVLATYVGDEFLALYHCVRSLAVKEPFPDAWNNLILLFEKNISCSLPSLSSKTQFDFLKPSKRSYEPTRDHDSSNCYPLKGEHDGRAETNLWSLIIRTLSFFFLKSSLEDFPSAFASTLRELDMVIAADDAKLGAELESYQLMDSTRRGPFRALQVVAIFIFIFHNQVDSHEIEGKDNVKNAQHLELTQSALTATFVFMGRLVERCLKANPVLCCPLLPTVLVFVEWLVSILDTAEEYGVDEKTKSAMAYFFAAFADLLKQLNVQAEISSHERTALWEDYELRGFAPLAQLHVSLDFTWEHRDSYYETESGKKCRSHRIIDAAKKIATRSNGSHKWIAYDAPRRIFYMAEANVTSGREETENADPVKFNVKVEGLHHNSCVDSKGEADIPSENLSNNTLNGKSDAVEEEEVILFKPLTRYNSAPLYTSTNGRDPASPKEKEDQTVPSDECLRRATSLLIAQNQAHGYPSDFHSDISNFRRGKTLKQQEPLVKDTTQQSFSEGVISAGPPSFNAWVLNRVLNRVSYSNDREKVKSENRQSLSPIEEMASECLNGLSICETEDSVTCSKPEASTNYYSSSVPSAPLLPDNASWFSGVQSSFSEAKNLGCINKSENFYNAAQISGYSNWTANCQLDYGPPIPGFMEKFPPFSGMTSSEWLRQYRESRNIERANSHAWPGNYYPAGNPRNFPSSPFGLFDQYGIPSVPNTMMYNEPPPLHPGFSHVYGMDEQRKEKLFHGYQRPSPFVCGAVTELRDDPQPLLQYLKEKEWLRQQDPTLSNHRYMGN
ncbi:hypothetical protein SLEP1_g13568 [Rubroshorea leprosula]|uniref:Uncharacterized protein n=1 Tax=Rubroshorea leprosula TaxID=152421 RepID=A0AAV5IM80_9ROSI|nr:hypothetical protein SLEP1_g13568 [Rubroshorea leprosula]